MSFITNASFKTIRNHYEIFAQDVESALATYRKEMQSSKAVFSEALFETKAVEYAATARAKIAAANDRLCKEVAGALDSLRTEMRKHISAPIPAGFVDTLRHYKDFGVKLSRAELEEYIKQADGSYPALRLLDAVAHNSGLSVKIPTVEDLEEDLKALAPCNPLIWAPDKYFKEAMEVLPDVPMFREDGTIAYSLGRPDIMALTVRMGVVSGAIKHADTAAARWNAGFVPTIEEIHTAAEANGEKISADEASAIRSKAVAASANVSAYEANNDFGFQQINREAEERAAETRAYYINGGRKHV